MAFGMRAGPELVERRGACTYLRVRNRDFRRIEADNPESLVPAALREFPLGGLKKTRKSEQN
jgi:hypothetical protein